MTLEKKITIPPLSYSSMNEIIGCEQRYVYRKILEVPPDEDYEDKTDAMDLGKAFHECLEVCRHNLNGFRLPTLVEAIDRYDTLTLKLHGPMLWAMLRRYKAMHEDTNLKVRHVEMDTASKEHTGYIDVILEEEKGYWVSDIKTAGMLSRFLQARLPADRQLNLYVGWLEKNKVLDKPILGCRYRVVTKSRLKQRKDEDFKAFSNRIFAGINAYEYIVPRDKMSPEDSLDTFKKVRNRQKSLWKNAQPMKNFNYCEAYFRPCQYWSRCHGKNFSDDFGVVEKIY